MSTATLGVCVQTSKVPLAGGSVTGLSGLGKSSVEAATSIVARCVAIATSPSLGARSRIEGRLGWSAGLCTPRCGGSLSSSARPRFPVKAAARQSLKCSGASAGDAQRAHPFEPEDADVAVCHALSLRKVQRRRSASLWDRACLEDDRTAGSPPDGPPRLRLGALDDSRRVLGASIPENLAF